MVVLVSAVDAAPADRRGFRNLLDAVVRLDVRESTLEAGTERLVRGTGSGVIVTEEGHILTNAHVVGPRAQEVVITLASLERVRARFIGWDHWTDLALVQLDAGEVARRGLKFAVARFGDSDRLRVGDEVFAVGTPNGLTRTVSRGIISNTRRFFEESSGVRGYETGTFNTWLQTDAAINPGNSGGPLVDMNGQVIGINTRGYLGANNLGFAVPAATVAEVLPALLENGAVERSTLGLRLGPLQDLEAFFRLSINQGVLIPGVEAGSPADRAGAKPGDILLALDGRAVDGRFPEQLPAIHHTIAERSPGSEIRLSLQRGEQRFDITATTEKLESRVGDQEVLPDWGISVEQLSRAVARELQMNRPDGVRVVGLQAGFPAAEAGLRSGDVIVGLNRVPVTNLAAARTSYEAWKAEPGDVLMEVRRFQQTLLLVLRRR